MSKIKQYKKKQYIKVNKIKCVIYPMNYFVNYCLFINQLSKCSCSYDQIVSGPQQKY